MERRDIMSDGEVIYYYHLLLGMEGKLNNVKPRLIKLGTSCAPTIFKVEHECRAFQLRIGIGCKFRQIEWVFSKNIKIGNHFEVFVFVLKYILTAF